VRVRTAFYAVCRTSVKVPRTLLSAAPKVSGSSQSDVPVRAPAPSQSAVASAFQTDARLCSACELHGKGLFVYTADLRCQLLTGLLAERLYKWFTSSAEHSSRCLASKTRARSACQLLATARDAYRDSPVTVRSAARKHQASRLTWCCAECACRLHERTLSRRRPSAL
jgi:hypothetical protein